jgi:H+/Cl- antiporter ClcA
VLYFTIPPTGCRLSRGIITHTLTPFFTITGIPETKAFLNGCDVKGAFSLQTFAVKAIGVCLVIAAGAPVGLEGPMVHIGAMVASHVVLSMEQFGLLRSNQDRNHLLTHLVTCGVASGISAAFNSPIGGVLFVVEDLAAQVRIGPFTKSLRLFAYTILTLYFCNHRPRAAATAASSKPRTW